MSEVISKTCRGKLMGIPDRVWERLRKEAHEERLKSNNSLKCYFDSYGRMWFDRQSHMWTDTSSGTWNHVRENIWDQVKEQLHV